MHCRRVQSTRAGHPEASPRRACPSDGIPPSRGSLRSYCPPTPVSIATSLARRWFAGGDSQEQARARNPCRRSSAMRRPRHRSACTAIRGGRKCDAASARCPSSGKSTRRCTPRLSSRASAGLSHQPRTRTACSAIASPRGTKTAASARSRTSGRSSRPPRPARPVAPHAHVAPHQALQRVADVGQVQGLGHFWHARHSPAAGPESRRRSRPPRAMRPRRRAHRTPALRAGCSRPADWRRAGRCEVTSPAAHRPGSVVRPIVVDRDAADHVVGARAGPESRRA